MQTETSTQKVAVWKVTPEYHGRWHGHDCILLNNGETFYIGRGKLKSGDPILRVGEVVEREVVSYIKPETTKLT